MMTIDTLHATLLDASGQSATWLTRTVLPTWLEHGVDWRRRGFRDNLDCTSLESPATYRRLRVAARQTFVFAHAAQSGVPRAGEAVELGIEFLFERARAADGGYAQRFNLANTVIDDQRNLYDHAFVLLALAAAAAVLPPRPIRRAALGLLEYLDATLAHPAGGFIETLPREAPRRQNPHMHLLEACLAAAEAFAEDAFLTRAKNLVRLFLQCFFDTRWGTLPECYDENLAPMVQDGRYPIEPGHHYEWAWLLEWYRRLAAPEALDEAIRTAIAGLLQTVDRSAVNPRLGTVYDEIWNDGTPKASGFRLWPQTERLKTEVLRRDASDTRRLAAYRALDRYILGAPQGLWFERLDADGNPVAEPAPASSLYHLTTGILFAHAHLGGGMGKDAGSVI